ncbi:L,D-transpeptidase family protein [Aurantimonas marianensis]|uniref:L,D-transpeptidase family protein n=1 Tax=Aurantimonas marianensis TaxID=2920428 RepID=A0A9X2H9U7_9HYPH|nr:L,D-transpeptidase family protein [Aurantimonas marianensis]MCP3056841.1 L,D-transpeptidase family protein [Aurantimonas marianensis]
MSVIARLYLPALVLSFGATAAWAQTTESARRVDEPVRLAQYYDPNIEIYDDNVAEVYIDEMGRRVMVDAYGRIIGVEQPRRQRFQERRQRFEDRRGAIIDGPPPPGVTLEGRVDIAPPGVILEPVPVERSIVRPRSADPYHNEPRDNGPAFDAPVIAAPLPAPSQPAAEPRREAELPPSVPGDVVVEPRRDAALPDTLPSSEPLPEPGAPIVQPEGQTVQESDPAPKVAGPKGKNAKAEIAALQILLDRAGTSPGVIDGRMGSNVDKAVAAYQEKYGRTLPTGDAQALAEELDATGGPAIVTYELTADDVAGPFVASIPEDYGEKALLPAMSYERPSEKIAEKFHMDEAYLREINPGADFSRPGTRIKVAAVGEPAKAEVAKIIADKGREQVRVYAADGTLITAYPSTIGSTQTPSPSGTVQVNRIAFDPNYTYNPKINFKQGDNDKVLTIQPGPNGPVGSIWIALSKPTYGIHGTPEPSKIGKTNSNGCVRLTNWDATELAKMVKPGVTVEFVE